MDNLVRQVRSNMCAKFYTTNDLWLSDCVRYYREEHENSSVDEVTEFAISQWVLSDLRDISNENPCLPKNLAKEKCTTLRGHFILQMDQVYDIAESKYKQLEKIRNVSTENIKVTEETTQHWEPKKKRMLYFHLTDGAQDVTAMEYKTIRIRHEQLIPGYKLLIKGPVTCRRGVIMLDETNVSGLGGEVDTILISNALENVLARALNLPENPDPYNDAVQPVVAETGLFDDDFDDIDMDAVEQIEKRSQEESTTGRNPRSTNSSSNVQSASNRSANRSLQPENKRIDEPPRNHLTHDSESDSLFDMIDETEFENFMETPKRPESVSNSIRENVSRVLPRHSDFPEDDEFNEIVQKPRIVEQKRKEISPRVLPKKMESPNDDDLILIEDEMEFDNSGIWGNQSSDPIQPTRQISDISQLKINTNVNPPATKPPSATKRVVAPKKTESAATKRNSSVLSPPVLKPPAEKIRCTQNTPKPNKNNCSNRKITDYLKKDSRPDISPIKTKICDNISDLVNANVTSEGLRKKIKPQLTKYDKLVTNGKFWALNGTMTDATGSIVVAFASEILEQFLGFTVTEMKQKKKLKKENPEIEEQLRKGFRNAEANLKNLDALLEVELVSGEVPKVIKIINITDEQRELLDKTAKLSAT